MGSAQWVASTEQGKSRPPAWRPRSQVGSILHISNATRCRGHYQNMLLFARSATTLHATAMEEWHVMISPADGGSKRAVPCRGSLAQGCMRPGGGFYDQTGHAIGWYRPVPRPAHPSHPLPVSHNPSCTTACHARRDGTVSGSGLERSQSDCLRFLGRRGDCSSSFAGLPSATGEKMSVIL